jgi:hypothetical protein
LHADFRSDLSLLTRPDDAILQPGFEAGFFEDPVSWYFMTFRDAAYLRDGLGLLSACDAMLMGRHSHESMSKSWPRNAAPLGAAPQPNQKVRFLVETGNGEPGELDDRPRQCRC